jgi:hypothetical protein
MQEKASGEERVLQGNKRYGESFLPATKTTSTGFNLVLKNFKDD